MTAEEQIKKLVQDHPVMLFMKGTPDNPQCGFSARTTEILKFLKTPFHSFNVLDDEKIRAGIKTYSSWPTIPQLYIKGEFIGGCDIVQEQFENGELEKMLNNIKK